MHLLQASFGTIKIISSKIHNKHRAELTLSFDPSTAYTSKP